jgi:hypothetical protein
MENGTRMYFLLIFLLSFKLRKTEKYEIFQFDQFLVTITASNSKTSTIFVFPTKNGTRLCIQMFPELSFGVSKPGNTILLCFYG